jgi:hypothetical protein
LFTKIGRLAVAVSLASEQSFKRKEAFEVAVGQLTVY